MYIYIYLFLIKSLQPLEKNPNSTIVENGLLYSNTSHLHLLLKVRKKTN